MRHGRRIAVVCARTRGECQRDKQHGPCWRRGAPGDGAHQEHGVHGLANGALPTEGERQIGHAAAHLRTRARSRPPLSPRVLAPRVRPELGAGGGGVHGASGQQPYARPGQLLLDNAGGLNKVDRVRVVLLWIPLHRGVGGACACPRSTAARGATTALVAGRAAVGGRTEAGADGENVGVKDDVVGVEADLVHKNAV